MKLGEQFRSNVITVNPHDSIDVAARKMKDENVGAVVVGRRGVVGILTDRDVALALAVDRIDPNAPVEQIMTKDAITIGEDEGVFNATQYIMGYKVRRLPIVNHDNEVVGMVTLDDLFALLAREMDNLAHAISPILAQKAED